MNPQKPLVTIITLCYNSEELMVSVDSVLKQSYPRIEYIILDDGSENFPLEAFEQAIISRADNHLERLVILKNPKNIGTVRSLNTALIHSLGCYIFHLAGDDRFADANVICDWVEAFIQTDSWVMTAYRDVYDSQLKGKLGQKPTEKQVWQIEHLPPGDLFEELTKSNFIFGCCTAYRRSCFETYGYYDEKYCLIEDYPKVLSLLRQGVKISFFQRVVVHYRSGGISAASNYSDRYEKDSDRIFQDEILPYTRFTARARKAYRKWKKEQALGYWFHQKLMQYSGNVPAILFLRIWYHAHHPATVIKRLLKRD